jgi:undecaprenyl-diphosphatase
MMAAAVYLTLAAMLAKVEPDRRLKALYLGTAMAVIVLVGISRVYLGVHWPSDVLAGWAAGAGWALICNLAARRLIDDPSA